jgi:hypothetical protein
MNLIKKVNSYGGKTRQREDREDRLIDYRLWKYKLNKLYTNYIEPAITMSKNKEALI